MVFVTPYVYINIRKYICVFVWSNSSLTLEFPQNYLYPIVKCSQANEADVKVSKGLVCERTKNMKIIVLKWNPPQNAISIRISIKLSTEFAIFSAWCFFRFGLFMYSHCKNRSLSFRFVLFLPYLPVSVCFSLSLCMWMCFFAVAVCTSTYQKKKSNRLSDLKNLLAIR